MTESLNAQGMFLSYTGRITGSLGFGVLQANPYLTSVWVNYLSPYTSARYPQGSVGFSANLEKAVTTLLGKEAVVYSPVVLGPPGANYTTDQLKTLGENRLASDYRSQGYRVGEQVPTQGGNRIVDVVARKTGIFGGQMVHAESKVGYTALREAREAREVFYDANALFKNQLFRSLGKGLGWAGIGIDAVHTVGDIQKELAAHDTTGVGRSVTQFAGRQSGTVGGAWLGGAVGFTFGGPIGALIGGAAGGIFGSFSGDWAAGQVYNSVFGSPPADQGQFAPSGTSDIGLASPAFAGGLSDLGLGSSADTSTPGEFQSLPWSGLLPLFPAPFSLQSGSDTVLPDSVPPPTPLMGGIQGVATQAPWQTQPGGPSYAWVQTGPRDSDTGVVPGRLVPLGDSNNPASSNLGQQRPGGDGNQAASPSSDSPTYIDGNTGFVVSGNSNTSGLIFIQDGMMIAATPPSSPSQTSVPQALGPNGTSSLLVPGAADPWALPQFDLSAVLGNSPAPDLSLSAQSIDTIQQSLAAQDAIDAARWVSPPPLTFDTAPTGADGLSAAITSPDLLNSLQQSISQINLGRLAGGGQFYQPGYQQ